MHITKSKILDACQSYRFASNNVEIQKDILNAMKTPIISIKKVYEILTSLFADKF
jgi:hypothetical protein